MPPECEKAYGSWQDDLKLFKLTAQVLGTLSKHKDEPVTLKRKLAKLVRDIQHFDLVCGDRLDSSPDLHPVMWDHISTIAGTQAPKRPRLHV